MNEEPGRECRREKAKWKTNAQLRLKQMTQTCIDVLKQMQFTEWTNVGERRRNKRQQQSVLLSFNFYCSRVFPVCHFYSFSCRIFWIHSPLAFWSCRFVNDRVTNNNIRLCLDKKTTNFPSSWWHFRFVNMRKNVKVVCV